MATATKTRPAKSRRRASAKSAPAKSTGAAAGKSRRAATPPVPGTGDVFAAVTSKFEPHPANPAARIEPAGVADLAVSIDRHGQREPIRVRDAGGGRWQILSGHRRWAACRSLGVKVRAVEVRGVDDAAAAVEVILGNAERRDLDPIQRADTMVSAEAAGATKSQIAEAFNLTASATRNAMRLALLPDSMRALVAEGKLPARAARYVLPFVPAVSLVDRWAEKIGGDEWHARRAAESPEEYFRLRVDGPNANARPMDARRTYRSITGQSVRRGFDPESDLTEGQKASLQLAELPNPDGKGKILVALGVEEFDRANKSYVDAAVKADRDRGRAKRDAIRSEQKSAASSAIAKFDEEKWFRREEKWCKRFRCAATARTTPKNHPVVWATWSWALSHAMDDYEDLLDAAGAIGIRPESIIGQYGSGADDARPGGWVAEVMGLPDGLNGAIDRLWRVILWPTPESVGPAEGKKPLCFSDPRPDRLPLDWARSNEVLDAVAAAADFTWADAWVEDLDRDADSSLAREWLEIQPRESLEKVARKVKFKASVALSDADLISNIWASGRRREIPVPASLRPPRRQAKRGPAKATRGGRKTAKNAG